jgi:signal transduction histidine kinase
VTRRLLVSYLIITVIVLVMLELPLAIFYRQRQIDRLTINTERDATVLASLYEDALQSNTSVDPTTADKYEADTGARVVVVDDNGMSVIDTGASTNRDFSTRPEFVTALRGERSSGTRRSDTLNTDLLYVAVPVASGGVVHGAVRVTLDTHAVAQRVHQFWLGLVAVAAVVLLVTAGVGWVLAQSITRPIRRLQHTAHRFGEGDLTPATPDPSAPPELAELESTLNSMAVRLDALIDRQRAFVADASHQLRTPLTALRLRLENLGSMTSDATETSEIDRAVEEITRLSTLVGELLQLARAEQPALFTVIDLVGAARDRVDTWGAVADQSDVTLTLEAAADELLVTMVAGGLEQVLDNLLDNAIRAAPAGSTILVRASAGSAMHELSIADQGAGLSPEAQRHALDRFWQADTTVSGSGLGLALVDTLVSVSGGTVVLGDNVPNGLVVTVRLPVVAAAPAAPRQHRLRQDLSTPGVSKS